MRKYLPHILIISFVFLLAPTAHVASHAGAIEDAKEEVRNNPDDASAHFNLGDAYFDSGKYQKAIKSYKRVIWIRPAHARAHYNLALSYSKVGSYKRAIKHYKKVIVFEDDDSTLLTKAHYNLGLIYIFRSKDRWAAEEQASELRDIGEWKLATRLSGMISTELD